MPFLNNSKYQFWCCVKSLSFSITSSTYTKYNYMILPSVRNCHGFLSCLLSIFRQQAYIKSESNLEQLKPQVLISMQDYTAYWHKAEDASVETKVMALGDINLDVSIVELFV